MEQLTHRVTSVLRLMDFGLMKEGQKSVPVLISNKPLLTVSGPEIETGNLMCLVICGYFWTTILSRENDIQPQSNMKSRFAKIDLHLIH